MNAPVSAFTAFNFVAYSGFCIIVLVINYDEFLEISIWNLGIHHIIQGPLEMYFLIPGKKEKPNFFFLGADSCLHSGNKSPRTMDGTKCFQAVGSEQAQGWGGWGHLTGYKVS